MPVKWAGGKRAMILLDQWKGLLENGDRILAHADVLFEYPEHLLEQIVLILEN